MTNKNYRKGVKFERELVNDARDEGLIAFRSAGSHSPVDVCIIDKFKNEIWFIQAKTGTKDYTKLEREFADFGYYKVYFEVRKK